MDAIVKAEWVDRLRNGNIPQCRGELGNLIGERCCLGVLSDIAVAHNIIPSPGTFLHDSHLILSYAGETNYLPKDVRSWAGLDSMNPEIGELFDMSPGGYSLSTFNDSGFTFDQIADVIEYFL